MRTAILSLSNLAAITIVVTQAALAEAAITGFGDFSNFTINKGPLDSGPSPNILPGMIELTDGSGGETRSIFHNTPQTISQFSASFNYQEVGGNAPSSPFVTQGATFILQNTSPGAHAVATGSGGYGFDGLAGFFDPHSAGVSLELLSTPATALYTQGKISLGGSNPTSPVNLLAGNPIHVSIDYNGTLLHETLTDSVTNAHSEFFYLVDLPQILGSSTAYVGFGAQTPTASLSFTPAQQYFSDFEFNPVPEPSSVLLLGLGVAALAWAQLRRRASR